MTEELILSEIHQLPENMKVEVLHFVQFLKQQSEKESPNKKRVFGRSKDRYKLAPDFDAPLDDFKEYIP